MSPTMNPAAVALPIRTIWSKISNIGFLHGKYWWGRGDCPPASGLVTSSGQLSLGLLGGPRLGRILVWRLLALLT